MPLELGNRHEFPLKKAVNINTSVETAACQEKTAI